MTMSKVCKQQCHLAYVDAACMLLQVPLENVHANDDCVGRRIESL